MESSSSRDITVMVVDFDHSRLQNLRRLVNGANGFHCPGAFYSVSGALSSPFSTAPRALVLGALPPGVEIREALSPWLRAYPRSVVVMLTRESAEGPLLEALRSGARGLLTATTHPGRLLEAIREACDGGSPISPALAATIVGVLRRSLPEEEIPEKPSDQEIRLLALLAKGHSYQTAGCELGISINTIRNYIRSIYQKLQVHSKSAAVTKALRAGLI